MKEIFFIILVYMLSFLHICNWEDCTHQYELMTNTNFISDWGYEKDTDGYLCEYTHFMNPSWTYEECEDYIFDNK